MLISIIIMIIIIFASFFFPFRSNSAELIQLSIIHIVICVTPGLVVKNRFYRLVRGGREIKRELTTRKRKRKTVSE